MVSYAYVVQNLSSVLYPERKHTEMFDSLSGVFLSSQQNGIRTLRSSQCQLIQSDDFSTRLLNSLTSSLGNSQCSNAQFGNFQHTNIIGDSSDYDNSFSLIFLGVRELTVNEADGDRWAVDAGLKKALEDDLVEFGVGSAGEEAVKLHEQKEIDIL